ncbi:MAG: hypothetical protein WCY53_05985 [Sphaerochaetaceae bacterium]
MQKGIIIIVLLIFSSQLIFAYEPYKIDEFPQWSVKLRRAETIAFGSLPITVAFVGLGYSAARSFGAPPFYNDPLKDSLAVIGIASIFALGIALADFIINEVRN